MDQALHNTEEVFGNLMNGNLTEAQLCAKEFSLQYLLSQSMGLGNNYNDALLMAAYLKAEISFQDYCDNIGNRK